MASALGGADCFCWQKQVHGLNLYLLAHQGLALASQMCPCIKYGDMLVCTAPFRRSSLRYGDCAEGVGADLQDFT